MWTLYSNLDAWYFTFLIHYAHTFGYGLIFPVFETENLWSNWSLGCPKYQKKKNVSTISYIIQHKVKNWLFP